VVVIAMMTDADIEDIMRNIKFSIEKIEELEKAGNPDRKVIYVLLGKCFGKLEILREYLHRE